MSLNSIDREKRDLRLDGRRPQRGGPRGSQHHDRRSPALALVASIALGLSGCYQLHGIDDLESEDPQTEEDLVNRHQDSLLGPITQADVLVVVDDSHSMATKQQLLSYALPWIAEGLTEGDIDRDGTPDFPGIPDVHFGVITPGGSGSLGVMRRACGQDTNVLRFPSPESPTLERFSETASCLINVGAQSYSLEQPLESMLRAVTPSTSSISFGADEAGQADRGNAGFLRTRSLLVIVMLTDEDDCSGSNRGVFRNHPSAGEPNMRCYVHPELLYPIDRYVDGLAAARRGELSRVLFMPIVGIPVNAIGSGAATEYDRILAHPRMAQYRQMNGSDRTYACLPSSGDGAIHSADPARRLLSFARDLDQLGATVVTESICDGDYSRGVEVLLDTVARRVQASYDAQDTAATPPPTRPMLPPGATGG